MRHAHVNSEPQVHATEEMRVNPSPLANLQSDDPRSEPVVQQRDASQPVITGLQSDNHQNEVVVQQNTSQPVAELVTNVNNDHEGLFFPPIN